MAIVMFWNIKGSPLYNEIGTLCSDYNVDIAIFAESQIHPSSLLTALNSIDAGHRYFSQIPAIASRIQFFTRYSLEWIEPRFDSRHVSMRLLKHPLGGELLIVAVHLQSKLYQKPEEQEFHVRHLMEDIAKEEGSMGHTRTMVIGDFNMDPFENGMITADGFHAIMDKKIAERESRKIGGKSYRFFYNPMWSRLGDESAGPCGT
jgi:hypothetical protein